MRINGTGTLTRTLMFNAVKFFGFKAWNKCKAKQVEVFTDDYKH
jgi:hypothetical protein